MADGTTVNVKDSIEAPVKAAETVVKSTNEVAKTVAATAAKVAPKAPAKSAKPVRATRKAKHRVVKKAADVAAPRKIKTAARKVRAAATNQRTDTVTNYDFFKGFNALPGFAPFQDMLAQVNDRGQEYAKRGQKVAEELADLTRANVEAVVESGRLAAEGTRALTQDAVSTSRDGFEKAADAIRSLAEAKSPTEYLQLQGEIARASFDRMVAEGSKMTETMVKLAGEAFQPISNRASANAERFNTLVA